MITQSGPTPPNATVIEGHLHDAIVIYKRLLPAGDPRQALFDSWYPAPGSRSSDPPELLCAQLRVVGRLIKELHSDVSICPEGMEECDGGCVPTGSCC